MGGPRPGSILDVARLADDFTDSVIVATGMVTRSRAHGPISLGCEKTVRLASEVDRWCAWLRLRALQVSSLLPH